MKNKLAKAAASTTKFVKDHKVAIAVTATAATCLVVHRMALKDQMNFLKEKGLWEEFVNPEAFAENL